MSLYSVLSPLFEQDSFIIISLFYIDIGHHDSYTKEIASTLNTCTHNEDIDICPLDVTMWMFKLNRRNKMRLNLLSSQCLLAL